MKYQLMAMVCVAMLSLASCSDSAGPQEAASAPSALPSSGSTGVSEPTATQQPQTAADAIDQAPADAPADALEVDLAAGEAIYNRSCLSCHAAGVAGAPKLGAAEDWAPRAAKGLDALVQSSLAGVPPAMPAKGLCFDCDEADMRPLGA